MTRNLSRYFWVVIGYTVLVILWGAYVRATGSGAGCGSHWPLCNGVVIPRDSEVTTWIEFSHRVTSGLSLVLVLLGGFWAFRVFPQGSFVRKVAGVSCISIGVEALIGAFLVLFELVLHDQSLKRVISIALHFSNTLVLLGSLVLSAMSIQRGGKGWAWGDFPFRRSALVFTLSFLALGMAGALTALGDTLFPAESLLEGLRQDWSLSSHPLIQLRALHPLVATLLILPLIRWVMDLSGRFPFLTFGKGLIVLAGSNFILGWVNLFFLAPIELQMIHLALALGVWIFLVLFLDQIAVSDLQLSFAPSETVSEF